MQAENTSTGHNRTIKLTKIFSINDDDLGELEITVKYTDRDPSPTMRKAACLDRVVIPEIVAAINERHWTHQRCRNTLNLRGTTKPKITDCSRCGGPCEFKGEEGHLPVAIAD